jgi:rare lipoprotein A
MTLAALVVLAYGCTSTAPQPALEVPSMIRGVASWYGEEFAGRTTANGEIFDPMSMTAAHRTLPFGTVLDVTNPQTSQTVRVRVNDRGPYIGNRVLDLSYAAAQQIGLIEPGVGNVDIKVVKVGSGEREPPAPFDVTIAESPKTAPVRSAGDPPPIAFPLPNQPVPPPPATIAPQPAAAEPEAVVDRVDVEVQRGDVVTRKQVSQDGTKFEEVPVARGEATTASSYDEQRRNAAKRETAAPRRQQQFFVQVGAFSIEANAKALQERLAEIGHRAVIDREALYRVRIGPYSTRDAAIQVRTALESKGVSAMIVAN